MTKVIVQIPCLNEETTLPLVFEKMPRHIEGVDELEFLLSHEAAITAFEARRG